MSETIDLPAATTGIFCDTCCTLVGITYFPAVTIEVPDGELIVPTPPKRFTVHIESCPDAESAVHPWLQRVVMRRGIEN